MDKGDKQMVRGILKKDKFWLKKFENQYRPRLLRFVLKKIGSYEDAEEIVQDTLLNAIYCLPSFLGKSCLSTWLCSIARHEIADFYRKKKIKTILFSHFPYFEKLAAKILSPEMALEEKEIEQKILSCFLSLKEGYREILRLKYIEGLSLLQIACHLKKTAKAIEMGLRRARQKFVKNWNETKTPQENIFSLRARNISFFKEYLGVISPSLQNSSRHQG